MTAITSSTNAEDLSMTIFMAPLTIEPTSTIAFSGGAVAHVFAAHP